jgi:serine/threonine protein phosphatase PrpC
MTRAAWRSIAASHVGTVRAENEDAFVDRPEAGLWAVADGAGGHADGAGASAAVARALAGIDATLSAGAMAAEVDARLDSAHADLRRGLGADEPGSASTVVVLIFRQDVYVALWAGDSRLYLLRDGALTQLTRDHSLVQELLDGGAITEAEAGNHPHGNVITRAVGGGNDALELARVGAAALPGDRFLLCSDGLTRVVGEDELAVLLAGPDFDGLAGRLIAAALARHARDNVTAVVVDFLGADQSPEAMSSVGGTSGGSGQT